MVSSFFRAFITPHITYGNISTYNLLFTQNLRCRVFIGPDFFTGSIAVLTLLFLSIALSFVFVYDTFGRSILQILFVATLSTFLATAITDPGIHVGTIIEVDHTPFLRTLVFCDFCCIMKSLDVVHCHDCNYCIMQRKHHCSWIGSCIGANNVNFFNIFNLCWYLYLFVYLVCVTIFLLRPKI